MKHRTAKEQDGSSMPEIELKPFLRVSVEADRDFDWSMKETGSRTIWICDLAKSALIDSETNSNASYEFETCVMDVGQLTGKDWALGSEIHDAILEIGGRLLSAREVFEIRTQYINQPDEELLWVAMTPMDLGRLFEDHVLQIEKEGRWLHLRTYDGGLDGRWNHESKFIFAVNR